SVVDASPPATYSSTRWRSGRGARRIGTHAAQVRHPVPLRLRRSGRAGRMAPTARIRRRGADERLAGADGQSAREHTPHVPSHEPVAGHETVHPHRSVPVLVAGVVSFYWVRGLGVGCGGVVFSHGVLLAPVSDRSVCGTGVRCASMTG